ncbi:MAG TPA: histidinol-phosphatase [Clostridiaceae bacterium]|nr:histidinol-phosphatase [Clostridiaceae bacterium]
MTKSTFHTHSRFDDGQEELETYIKAALEKNFQVFGFSAHAPVNFKTSWHMQRECLAEYIATTKLLKKKYKNDIEIYTGLETDYYDGCTDWRPKRGIDYTIGAIHFLVDEKSGRCMSIDSTLEDLKSTLKEFDNDIHALIKAYFSKIRDMLLKMTPNIVAHLDVIRKNNYNNAFFDEDDSVYREEILKTLEIISLTNTIVEVNTGGVAKGYVKTPYPSKWVLEVCHDMDIPIILNSDSHHPNNIDFYYDEAITMLKSIGINKQRILYKNEWCDVSL